MKILKYPYNSLLIVLITITLSSCLKSKESKLTGNWESQALDDVQSGSNNLQNWTFDAGYKIKIEDLLTDTTQYYEGIYALSSKNMGINGYYLTISKMNSSLNGRYKIIELSKTKLVLHRIELENGSTSGAFLWKDMLKKD